MNSPGYDPVATTGRIANGAILDGDCDMAQMGERIFAHILRTASGDRTRSELLGLGDHEFVPWLSKWAIQNCLRHRECANFDSKCYEVGLSNLSLSQSAMARPSPAYSGLYKLAAYAANGITGRLACFYEVAR